MHTTYRVNEENIPHIAERLKLDVVTLRRIYFVALLKRKDRQTYPRHNFTLVFERP